ncbi:efflux transporter outer membrane subunit [Stenotrophomonas maltophilia]|uniref:efflux transporter outer membrane subunit n=1 Tax=Stenotrophomonas TaxID=40323 RepID=UPI0012FB7235|nr:efflux transporter outer membrane subunit [Stenotrophomonas sp. SKA14]
MRAIMGLPLLLAIGLLPGCSLAPAYHGVPLQAAPGTFKEAPGWSEAVPSDAVGKGQWWTLFNDPQLDALQARVVVDNQNVAQYRATYAAARALVQQQRAALWPQVTAQGTGTRSGGQGSDASGNAAGGRRYSVQVGASWEPDLWGRVGNSVSQASAEAAASAGDLANATLSAQGELAIDYLQLRGLDAQHQDLAQTVQGYQRSLDITGNKYAVGVAAAADVEQARTTLANAQAQLRTLDLQRAQLEHAIAVLIGENPSTFRLVPAQWNERVPAVPSSVPSQVLLRRADVAAAERRVAAANANIGIQRAGYFPQFTISGDRQSNATAWGQLFTASTSLWSLGISALQTVFDAGATRGRVAQARAEFDQAAAVYRQTVLGAFQQVEDNLVAMQVYADVSQSRVQAEAAANRAEVILRNQYRAGTVDYTAVVVAQGTASSARQARIQAVVDRQTAMVALAQAIGGSWVEPAAVAVTAPAPSSSGAP